MNKKIKNVLTGVLALVVFAALVICAPVSRIIYGVYDTNRTNEILAQLEAAEKAAEQEAPAASDYQKRAYFKQTQETVDGKTVEKLDLLVLTSESGYELSYYERVVDGAASYTAEYFHMTGNYTREGNLLTMAPGIAALAKSKDGVSYTYYNAQFLTAEEAAGDKTRDEIYDMMYASRNIALMSDGTFVVGGESDSADVLGAPEGRHVYTSYVAQGRKTYNTLVLVEGGVYFLYNHATNSTNAEQTTGCMFGVGNYEILDANKGIVPDATEPEKTYDIVNCGVGIGYMYACNNGSHMHFDLQTGAAFSSWLGTSFNTTTPTFYVSESGFNLKLGALKTTVEPWGLYVPAGESAEQKAPAQPAATEAPAAQSLRLEVETSVEGKPFVLELGADGTLLTGWTNYEQTMQNGTWKIADGKLVLDMAYDSTITENAEGGLDITVNYGQMGEKTYTMDAGVFAAMKGVELPAESLRLEVETSVEGKPFVLEFNVDGTLLTGWTNYEQTMQNGAWKIADGKLALDMAYGSTIAENAEGGLDITVNYGQMGEKTYAMTAEQLAALKGIEVPAASVRMEVETSVEGKPFILELNADGTLLTGWTNYEQTMVNGRWTVADGALALEMGAYTAAIVQNAEGGLDITVNYGQMGEKTYTMTAEQAATLHLEKAAAGEDIQLEVETSVPGKPFVLTLNADGTLLTGWTNYEQTMVNGSWTVADGALALEMGAYTAAIAENAEGGLDITVNYGQMGEKTYTMTAEQASALHLEKTAAGEDIQLEVETSVPGKPFVLNLNADGTLLTGWTNYEQTMVNGSWAVADGALALEMGAYTAAIAQNAEGGLDITVNYGQMGEKTYTMTAEQAALLLK